MNAYSTLRVGYAKREITPPLGVPLAGRPMLVSRRARAIRDSLSARAVHIEAASGNITILSVDLLLITKTLHLQIAQAANCAPDKLLVLATHTHSGPGGYWRGRHIESFMGPYDAGARDRLVESLSETVREANRSTRPARMSVVTIDTNGISSNRRNHKKSVDSALTVLRFDVDGDSPVCIVSFGAHPIGGLERKPFTITADYPGDVCQRLEGLGLRPVFIQGACAGTGPAHFHIARIGASLVDEIITALHRLEPSDVTDVVVELIPVQPSTDRTRIAPDGMLFVGQIENRIQPLRRYLMQMAQEGAIDNQNLSLTIAGIGRLIVVGIPGEVGPELSTAIRGLFPTKSVAVASLCNGYAGYLHTRNCYRYERGTRTLALYENAMSLAGRDAGDSILAEIERSRIRMSL